MKKYNKPQSYAILTFGCQMNYSDTERFAAILESDGIKPAKGTSDADLIIINTCSVRQKAEDRIVGLGKKLAALKSTNPNLIIVLSGCMARRSWDDLVLINTAKTAAEIKRQNKLFQDMPWLDIILETRNFPQILNIINNRAINPNPSIEEYLNYTPNTKGDLQGFIPISFGCNHFCTYCIVPFARGKEVCRSYDQILVEFQQLIQKGYKDITLLGQTVNRWINPKFHDQYDIKSAAAIKIPNLNTIHINENSESEPHDFLQLLEKLDQLPGDFWLSFVSSHPNYMTREIIDFMARAKHVKPYFHFALQSGSNKILAKMNRGYSVEDFSEIAKYYKQQLPDATLSTDIIVGFPGETEEDFQLSANIMRELKFDTAFISEFSPRKGTAAARITDDITLKTKAQRKAFLNDEILAHTALQNNQQLIGKEKKALLTKLTNKFIFGRLDNGKEIRIDRSDSPDRLLEANTFINVQIIDCTSWALSGKLL
jgi:tRNA-2-methylthio-N6-dimethylallyladenosine synthase